MAGLVSVARMSSLLIRRWMYVTAWYLRRQLCPDRTEGSSYVWVSLQRQAHCGGLTCSQKSSVGLTDKPHYG